MKLDSLILFNPYPAKADCDIVLMVLGNFRLPFQPISSESGLRQGNKCQHIITSQTFQPISSESGLRRVWGYSRNIVPASFQPISSESGLRPSSSTSCLSSNPLFNPYPAKADCDFKHNVRNNQKPFFSTHIQRKRIATYLFFTTNNFTSPFQPISSESGLRPKKLLGSYPSSSFSTHIQRKRIATIVLRI